MARDLLPRRPAALRISRRSALAGLGAAAVGIALSPGSQAAASRKINFHNWDTYIGDTTLDDFTAASGIAVNMSLFATNAELFTSLRGGNPGYDVIVPGSELVERLIQADLLLPLDHAQIPNIANIAPAFMREAPYDPGRRFSLPYTYLVIGIGYHKSGVKAVPDTWKVLFDSNQYRGRISVVSDASELYRHVFKYLGHSANSATPELILKAEEILRRQKPFITSFHADNGQDLLRTGEVDLVMEYNGDIAQLMAEDGDIGFVVPKEGALKQSDTLAIPKGAPNPEGAHAFIDFLLDAEVGRDITTAIKFPSPNAAATALMPEAYRNNPVIFPPGDVLARCEYPRYPGPDIARLMEESMARLRAD